MTLDTRTYLAIDFETADTGRDSACALAAVRIEANEIVERKVWFIKPPRSIVKFADIHGLTWDRLRLEPTFVGVWTLCESLFQGIDAIVAHNAKFDTSVLKACCEKAGIPVPAVPSLCTVDLVKKAWNLNPAALPDACRYIRYPLDHHNPLSDADACANILLTLQRTGKQALIDERLEAAKGPPKLWRRTSLSAGTERSL